MKSPFLTLCVLSFLSLGIAASTGPTVKRKAWITIGDGALRQVKAAAPDIVVIDSRQFGVAGAAEKVHAVVMDESRIGAVTAAIHQRMGQCGGFMYHASEAEARAALARRAAAPPARVYEIKHRDLVEPILASMDEQHIEATIVGLSGFANRYYRSRLGVDASNWLLSAWRGLATGRDDISVAQVVHPAYPQPSVTLTIAGTDLADEKVVVGAHLDSILSFGMSETARAPGADDDASGVASMTEALRAIIGSGYRPRRTIYVVAYAAEEAGLRGSQEIARSFRQAGEKVAGVLQLDMTNYKGAPNDIYLITDYTNGPQNAFLAQLAGAYLPSLKVGYDRCGYGCSDHASWDAQGYPASMPFESSMARDNPYIHTGKDTLAHSGSQTAHALKFARLAAAYMVELSAQ
ncbi:M20/M25/M40 family metallo-hydrolase [Massilia yuzhufengensis]|uniref:Leucyl aminopeptidase Metallo peptidase. MEROPS family M28E n=1 Tax=Massilia yuzhufengensis TaxID=1164594 RepID=A0A1I1WIH4_9BURK|nr:M20/M25/M40 family metallo-hydrolase [Massilia yuzhufengensis]SFD94985.1 leucyl aminopeptidase Metallo peptidase. MEROPS family M28E [Massilia yuzhufengensis]